MTAGDRRGCVKAVYGHKINLKKSETEVISTFFGDLETLTTNEGIFEKFIGDALAPLDRYEAVMPLHPDSSEMLVAVDLRDYSASTVAKAVEDCDVQLLGLAVTAMTAPSGRAVVWLRVAARGTAGIERSLARYGYETVYALEADARHTASADRERVNELLRYLNV